MHPLERRIRRLDHGKSLQDRVLAKLTDDELEVQIKDALPRVAPALADMPISTVAEIRTLIGQIRELCGA
jgi:hypothetical protein